MAKMCLRGTNFSCSLIVLAMLSTTFSIFNATKGLAPRSNLPPWAAGQKTWPQITLLTIACVSLAMSLVVIYGYWKGGHKRAEKAAIYYTFFSIAYFTFATIMWIVGAAVLHSSKANGNGKDMWGWSCKDGKRKDVFDSEVNYALVCRLQVRVLPAFLQVPQSNRILELVAYLCPYRDHCRGYHHFHLCYCLLSLLFEAEARQVHGSPGQSSNGSLSGSTQGPICSQHSWHPEDAYDFQLPLAFT